MRCALFTHPDCLLHEAEPGHPERPARLVAILNHLIETGLESELDYLTPNPAGIAISTRSTIPVLYDRCMPRFRTTASLTSTPIPASDR
jgi:acetoin utilization deacetylase AcuC-like enzyme